MKLFLTLGEAAEYCEMPEDTLRKWTESGHAPHYFIDDIGPLYKRNELKAWVMNNLLRVSSGMPIPRTMEVLKAVPRLSDGTSSLPTSLQAITPLLRVSLTATCSGIYFLCYGDEVVYVGQAINVMARLCSHVYEARKQFDLDRIYFLPCPKEELDAAENHWIVALNPRYNRAPLRLKFRNQTG